MAGSSGMHFGRAAYRAGMVSRGQIARWGLAHLRFRLRGSTDADTDGARRPGRGAARRCPRADAAAAWSPRCWPGSCPAIYPQMIDEVRAHQDAGRPTFIVSAAGDGIVELLARCLDMDGGIGTRYSVDRRRQLHRPARGRADLRPRQGRPDRALRRRARHRPGESWAYSDSASDLPMLELVGNPVAVNPDARRLRQIARERGWRVMRFEKLGRRLAVAAPRSPPARSAAAATSAGESRRPARPAPQRGGSRHRRAARTRSGARCARA